jgi:hypothetical protein
MAITPIKVLASIHSAPIPLNPTNHTTQISNTSSPSNREGKHPPYLQTIPAGTGQRSPTNLLSPKKEGEALSY